MGKILCSTGAFIGRVNGRDHRLIMKYAPELHCDGFEFMIYGSWYDNRKEIESDLRASGLSIPVLHMDKQIRELLSRNEQGDENVAIDMFKTNCDMAKGIGSEMLVLHLWGGNSSDRNISFNIDKYAELNEIAKSSSLQLTIENVVCNRQNPMKHLAELRKQYSDITFTYDTKMAAFHSELELIYEPEWDWLWRENHIRHMHMNDYMGGHMDWNNLKALHMGEGKINFDRFFDCIKNKNYEGDYTVESTSTRPDGTIDIEKLNHSLDYIRQNQHTTKN